MRILASLLSIAALVISLPVLAAGAPDQRVSNLMDQLQTAAGLVQWTVDPDGDFKMEVGLSYGRTQIVYINSATEKWPDDSPDFIEIREVWAPAFPSKGSSFPKKTANMLLQDSQHKKLGAWQAYPLADNKWFAVFNVKIGADSDASSLASIVKYVALAADQMELSVLGTDQF